VLGFYEVIGKHNNENIAAVLFNIFKDYKIHSNIRYFMADNTELNDIYIDVILWVFYLGMLIKNRRPVSFIVLVIL